MQVPTPPPGHGFELPDANERPAYAPGWPTVPTWGPDVYARTWTKNTAGFGEQIARPGLSRCRSTIRISWYDFGMEIARLSGSECTVRPIPTEAYPLPAQRPFYGVMSKTKFTETFGYSIPYWRDSLERCMNNLQENIL